MHLPKVIGVSVVVCIVIFLCQRSFATSPLITNYPTGIIGLNQQFTVTATMSGLSKSSIYRLRLALAQSVTSNYFGSTWNGSYWYNGTPSPINYADFLSITTDNTGAWWGDVQGEIDANDPNFTTGSGAYDLKLGRYTQTGTSATWSDPVNVTVSIPPQPTDTPIPTNTPVVPTPTSKIPTAIPTVLQSKLSPTHSTSSGSSTSIMPTSLTNVPAGSFGEVLGTSPASPTKENIPTLVAGESDQKKEVIAWLPLIFILFGFGLLASCGILIFLQTEKGKFLWKKLF